MKYNFDQKIYRIGTSCEKWDSKEIYKNGQVIPMWVADMDFITANPIMESIRRRAEHPVLGYVCRGQEFSDVTVGWMKKNHGWEAKPEWVTYSPGIVPAISITIQALTKPGDGVIIQPPVYYPFAGTIKSCGRRLIENPLKYEEGYYKMDFDDLERKAQDASVKLLILCNPHNPVGRVYSAEELEQLGTICLKHNVRIFSDEIHSDLIFKGNHHIPLASLSSRFSQITLTGVSPSKTFNTAGLQTSAVICENPEMKKEFERIVSMNGISFSNVFGLEAYKAAYADGMEYREQLMMYLEENVSYCRKFLKERIPVLKMTEPQGTYLLWIDCRRLEFSQEELEDFMLNKAYLALDSGICFGEEGKGFMRMNVACPLDTVKQALHQLEVAVRGKSE